MSRPGELKYLYENHADFSAIPSYFIMPGLMLSMTSSMVHDAITHTDFDLSQVNTIVSLV